MRRCARRSARRGGGSRTRSPLPLAPGPVEGASEQVTGADRERARCRVEEEVVSRRDDDDHHQGRVAPADHTVAERGERQADEQRVPEVQARHRGERVVEAAEQVRAEVDLRLRGDGVHKAEAGKARGCDREEDVERQRDARGGDHRVAYAREALRVAPVQPDEEGCGPDEVQRDVGDAEERRDAGEPVGRTLHGALAKDVEPALEADDPVRVGAGGGERRVALAADDLVEAVERDERGDLGQSAVGGGCKPAYGRHTHKNEATPANRPRQCGFPYSWRWLSGVLRPAVDELPAVPEVTSHKEPLGAVPRHSRTKPCPPGNATPPAPKATSGSASLGFADQLRP